MNRVDIVFHKLMKLDQPRLFPVAADVVKSLPSNISLEAQCPKSLLSFNLKLLSWYTLKTNMKRYL